MDDLVGVTDHSEVRIVGDDNDLPTLLCILNRRHQDIRYCLVIKIFLWLIDDEWDVAHINQQIKDQAGGYPAHRAKVGREVYLAIVARTGSQIAEAV